MVNQRAVAHSGMFPDTFKYDDSNEGRKTGTVGNSENGGVRASAVSAAQAATPCTDGLAGDYPCLNIHLKSQMSASQINSAGGNLNDIWGWTDVTSGMEVAIVGREAGTSFVDIRDPEAPVFLGYLRGHGNGSAGWRDIKVYQDFAFIVADGQANASHGLQVFDLTQLRNITPGSTLTESAQMGGFGSAHNIAINEDTGFAYVVGSDQCSGGLYMVDISDPLAPAFAGCFSADGYTHDAQCVTYQGPDSRYFNREICVAYNEDSITLVDVTDKANPAQLARETYPGSQYTHQGWFLNDNHSQLIMNDELDEQNVGVRTTSYLYDVSILTNPELLGTHVAQTRAIDHNLYTRDNFVFESNYRAGLRILDSSEILSGQLSEKAYFDTIPCSDSAQFSGSWSSYVDFPSGNIVTSDIGTGLFVLEPDWDAINDPAGSFNTAPATSPACSNNSANNLTSDSGGGGGAVYWGGLILLVGFGLRRIWT
jgi:choice-of-anchor B domain-containing protein